MAFQNKNFAVIAYANGFTMWVYKTRDDIDMIDAQTKYFPAGIVKLMNVGDIIIINSGKLSYLRCVEHIHDNEVFLAMLH